MTNFDGFSYIVDKAAMILNIDQHHLFKLIEQKEIKAYKVKNSWRVPLIDNRLK